MNRGHFPTQKTEPKDLNLSVCGFASLQCREACLSVRLLIYSSDQPASPGEAGASTETDEEANGEASLAALLIGAADV